MMEFILKHNFKILIFSLTAILAVGGFSISSAFAQNSEDDCGVFEITKECGITTETQITIEIIIAVLLSFIFYYLSERNNREIKKIIQSNKEWENARRDYAVRNMKDNLNTLDFILGRIKKLTSIYNKEGPSDPKDLVYEQIKTEQSLMHRFLTTARNGLIYSSDVFDPVVMYEIEGLCTFMSQMTVERDGDKLIFEKFEDAKNKIRLLSLQLRKYRNMDHSFEDYVEEVS